MFTTISIFTICHHPNHYNIIDYIPQAILCISIMTYLLSESLPHYLGGQYNDSAYKSPHSWHSALYEEVGQSRGRRIKCYFWGMVYFEESKILRVGF